jgi:hypothetical protein
MPLTYWLAITEYQVNVEKTRQEWEAWLEIYHPP